jgi:hypothetical protein
MTTDVIKEVIDRIYEWIRPLEKFNGLPMFFHNIELALLTILIPFAIAILADFYQKGETRRQISLSWTF